VPAACDHESCICVFAIQVKSALPIEGMTMTSSTDDITPGMIDGFLGAAHTAALCQLVGMLIEKGVLNQGDVIAKYEALSKQLMSQPGARYSVPVIDMIRDYAAADQNRKPS